MNASDLLAELRTAGIAVQVHAGRLKLDAPRGALTESVLSAVRDFKVELLKLLEPADVAPTPGAALFHRGPGAGSSAATPTPARAAPIESITQSTRLGDDPKVDAEFDRFFACAISTPSGGLRDPVNCSAGLAKQIRVGGIPWEDMERFETDCAHLGRGVRP